MQSSLMVLQSLLILSTPVLSQYNNEVRPDVTFGDHNDRFDVSDLVSYQNKYFRADGSIDYRRSHGSKKSRKFRSESNPKDKRWFLGSENNRKKYVQKVKKETEEELNKLANIILLRMKSGRRDGEDFAYHDKMEDNGGDTYDFNENLKKFEMHLSQEINEDTREPRFNNYRRVGTIPDTFNYAFPIEMQVEGYLVPFENL